MAGGYGKKQVLQRPDGTVRQSQVVSTFGPGAMVDLLDQAVLVGGLDFWNFDKKRGVNAITEPRLRDAIAERFRAAGLSLNQDKPFREPPVGNDREPSRFAGVQVLEFPQWFVCQSEDCRTLMRKDGLELKKGRYWHNCSSKNPSSETVPVRFLGACKRGHVEDFPWIRFAHMGKDTCAAPSLRLREGSTGDFSEIEVRCACGLGKALNSANAEGLLKCGGHRPWLGREGGEECEENLRLLVRTASNSYFAQVVSALSIPEPGRELEAIVREHYAILKVATKETLPGFRTIPMVSGPLKPYSDAEVLRVVDALRSDSTAPRDALRTAEFKQFVASQKEVPGDLPPPNEDFFARTVEVEGGLPAGLARLVVASKLREVRAQIGFTRLEPVMPDLQGEFDLGVQSARLSLTQDWLPATEVRGEGVFIQLDEAAVAEWEARPVVQARAERLLGGYEAWASTIDGEAQFPGVRYYLLHSLAHLIISAISLECGYSASAIRERIYCGPSKADPNTPMAAILLSTGTSGNRGHLGRPGGARAEHSRAPPARVRLREALLERPGVCVARPEG
jgi:hypothetical protein